MKISALVLGMGLLLLPATGASALASSVPAPASPAAAEVSSDPTIINQATSATAPLSVAAVLTASRIGGTEPTVSVNPDNGYIAVASQHIAWPRLCSRSSVTISRDGGRTWSAQYHPMGSRCEDIHAVVAWGPNNRLWFGDALALARHRMVMSVSYSDNFGVSWSHFYSETFTPGWVGCFPMLIVDNEPMSPAYGTVYVAYNWLAGRAGPGLHIMAKPLNGAWSAVEVPVVGLAGYSAHNRIGYRLEPIAGGLTAVWYESDLRRFPSDILIDGASRNIGRVGFATASLSWSAGKLVVGPSSWARTVSATTNLLKDPRWQYQIAADYTPTPGYSALGLSTSTWLAVSDGRGGILVGNQQTGSAWAWRRLGTGFHPVIAIERADTGRQVIFVGWHAGAIVRNYYTLSYDGGLTWTPVAQAGSTWRVPRVINGAGLRENAVFGNGRFVWAFGTSATTSQVLTIRP